MASNASQTNTSVELSLILPAYNEGTGIEKAVRKATTVMERLTPDYEMVVVNDGSSDNTGAILDRLADELPRLRPIHLRRNAGQHMAIVVGLRNANGAYCITADADEQVPLDSIEMLYRTICADPAADIVSGARSIRHSSLYRSAGSRLLTWIINFGMNTRLADPGTPFRIFRREAVEELLNSDALAQNIPILVTYLGLKNREIEVEARGAADRKSSYGVIKLIHTLLLALLNFSSGMTTILTLMAGGILGFVLGVAGLVGIVLYGLIESQPLPTNWLLFFVLLVVLGMQFLLIGAVAYKVERLNINLRFRQHFALLGHDRDD